MQDNLSNLIPATQKIVFTWYFEVYLILSVSYLVVFFLIYVLLYQVYSTVNYYFIKK